jgi:molecular chaperone GrpE
MFNSLPALAGVPNGMSPEKSEVSTRLAAMLPASIRGRGLGRGAPSPGAPTPHHHAPEAHPPSHAPETHVAPSNNALSPEFLDYIEAMGQNIAFLREQMGEMHGQINQIQQRSGESQKVFDVLHHELNDYKRDFIYEHLKPLLRPLLFLYDSLQEFDGEMKLYETAQLENPQSPGALPATKVRQNIGFLRDQLTEALSVCEVEPIPVPSGHFDAKNQKAIDTAPTSAELDGTIVQVVRIGWTMHGHLMRPAEVILGKAPRSS